MNVEKKKKSNNQTFFVKFDKCPDYYSKVTTHDIEGGIGKVDLCMNFFKGKSINGDPVYIRVYPLNDVDDNVIKLPETFDLTTEMEQLAENNDYRGYRTEDLDTSKSLKTSAEKCGVVFNKPSSDLNIVEYDSMSILPWTYARSRCQGLTAFS